MNCRPAFLLAFIVICSAVVGLDRYLTTDAVKLCMESNKYNCEELAQIRVCQDAQVAVGEHLKSVRALGTQLERAIQAGEMLAGRNLELARENQCLYETIKLLNDMLNEAGVKMPEPPLATPPANNPGTPAAIDRET